ncbi:DUF4352 domain-containing protein [Actinomadura sp. ATCC 31491]|uniref:DUF4352 domain-containing protein n=1 Tax=Actinomadura luzonensis TaxID=2805427 RepID=A0ABT0G5A8_9ACTN|nr:DUF4352 domain-containing protein [Actinomadura luzonensis]MCK2219689.1 DUF4352 domain-containing protein [Actinomadura luzonensis]
MGYPPQPQDPYGQQPPYGSGPQHPQQSYGSGPQRPYGYGYQQPKPPPPKRSNTGLIVLLAVGIPLLLLGGCAAIVAILGDSTSRDRIVTQPDSPNAVPSKQTSAPPSPAEPSTANVGGAITLEGFEGVKMSVTLTKLVDPATAGQYTTAKAGHRLVAVQLTLKNIGQAVYSDSPTNGAYLIDADDQQYSSSYQDVREGQSFGGQATINTGDSRKGVIVFEVPKNAKLSKFQFGLNSGFADQKGEWTLS